MDFLIETCTRVRERVFKGLSGALQSQLFHVLNELGDVLIFQIINPTEREISVGGGGHIYRHVSNIKSNL